MITSTIGPGKDFSTLQAWADDQSGADDDEEAICYSGADLGAANIFFCGWRSATIRVAAGHQHNGQDAGVIGVAYISGSLVISDIAPVVSVSGLRIQNGGSLFGFSGGLAAGSSSVSILAEKMMVVIDGAAEASLSFNMTPFNFSGGEVFTASVIFRNNIVYWKPTSGSATGLGVGAFQKDGDVDTISASVSVYNNTLVRSTTAMDFGVDVNQSGEATISVNARNNLVLNGAGICYNAAAGTSVSGDHNLSSDASGDDWGATGSLINQTATNIVVNPSTNATLKSTSSAKNAGADLSGTGFSDDAIGVSRPQGSAWDMGALELVGSSGRLRRFSIRKFWN